MTIFTPQSGHYEMKSSVMRMNITIKFFIKQIIKIILGRFYKLACDVFATIVP